MVPQPSGAPHVYQLGLKFKMTTRLLTFSDMTNRVAMEISHFDKGFPHATHERQIGTHSDWSNSSLSHERYGATSNKAVRTSHVSFAGRGSTSAIKLTPNTLCPHYMYTYRG